MTLIVDASVALKWVLAEEGSDRAKALIGSEPLAAPELLIVECANALTMRVRRKLLTRMDAEEGLALIAAAPVRLVSSTDRVATAQALAIEFGQSAYDALYLATALAEGATLITADSRFARAVSQAPAYAGTVRVL